MSRRSNEVDGRLRALASHGVVTRSAAEAAGIHHSRIADRVRSGWMEAEGGGQFVIATERDDLTVVALRQARYPGAVAWRATGALVARLDGLDRLDLLPPGVAEDPELIVPRRPHRLAPNAIVARIARGDVRVASGLRVLRPLPLLRSVAEVLPADSVEAVVEDLIRDGKVTEEEVWELAPSLPTLRAVLAQRPRNTPCTGSYAETLAIQRVFRPAGLTVERQVPVQIGSRPIGVFDFRLDGCLFVEVNSVSFHSSREMLRRDSWHAASVRLTGCEIETLWWDDITRLAAASGRRLRERVEQIQTKHMFDRMMG